MGKDKTWFGHYLESTSGMKLNKKTELEKKQVQLKQDQFDRELEVPRTLRTELNFLKFPFFDLAKNSARENIKIEEWVETKEGTFHIYWLVERNVSSQFPGDFEKRLHRAIEQIINANPKPITNPLKIGSLRYVTRLMGIHADSGKNYNDIVKTFKNIVKTSIEAEGSFKLKESKTKRHISDTFHLYDRVVFKGEKLPDGKSADCVYLMLGSWYLQNINNNYVVPLDWHFYNRLSGTITTRMYEVLSLYFFTALERGYKYHDLKYSYICAYFPLVPQKPKWKARKQLKQSHSILASEEYVEKVEWLDTQDGDDWLIRYWIGKKARDEYQNNKSEYRHSIPLPARRRKLKASKTPSESKESKPEKLSHLIEKLASRGLSHKIAEKLTESYSESLVAHKIDIFDWLVETKSKLQNPAGFLRKSIEDNFADPPGYLSKEEIEKRKIAAADRNKRQEWQEKVEAYKSWKETDPKHLIYWPLHTWKKEFKKENGRDPSVDEIKLKEEELIKSLPSDEEKQKEMFGKIVFEKTDNLFDKLMGAKSKT